MVERVIGNDEVTGPIPVPSFFCVFLTKHAFDCLSVCFGNGEPQDLRAGGGFVYDTGTGKAYAFFKVRAEAKEEGIRSFVGMMPVIGFIFRRTNGLVSMPVQREAGVSVTLQNKRETAGEVFFLFGFFFCIHPFDAVFSAHPCVIQDLLNF